VKDPADALSLLRIVHILKQNLADALSLLRILLTPFVILFALVGEWHLAFALLVIAWTTDLFDGFAARRFGSRRDAHPKFDADGLADTVLAFGAASVPLVYLFIHGSVLAYHVVSILYALTVISGVIMALVMDKPATPAVRWSIGINMVIFHGLVQIGAVTTWFAYMAGGSSLTTATVYSMAIIAVLQRHKIGRWFSGAL
jgi:phosphatidylglycerophosphate synthase